MIEVKNLVKKFTVKEKLGLFKTNNKIITAVNDVSLVVPKGKITGLLGINGAGKTTTIKMLSTLIEPTSGTILYSGRDYKTDSKSIKRDINMIAGGERMIYWRLTARENLMYFGQMYGISGQFLRNRVNILLERVGLTDKADIPVEKYSKGMKQRLQIARGLVNNPTYLFLDEPTLGLDVQFARDIRGLLKEFSNSENKGLLLTSHYMQEVEELCDYIYIMHNGKIIKEGTTDEIIKLHATGENDSLESAILAISNDLCEVSACTSC